MEKKERDELLRSILAWLDDAPATPSDLADAEKLRTLFADYDALEELWEFDAETRKQQADTIGKLEVELEEKTQLLCDAAREIHCAGPVAHRIRVLKKEHHEHILRLDARARELRDQLAEMKQRWRDTEDELVEVRLRC